MKEKIIIFAIGLLVGAVLSTGAFLVFSKSSKCDMDRNRMEMRMNNRQSKQNNQPNMPGNNMPNNPNGNNNQTNQQAETPNNNAQNNN